MQTEQSENKLIIRETPGCLWVFGLFFAIVGGIFVYGAVGGFVDYGSQSPLMLAIAFVMGAIGVAVGAWIIYRAPLTKVVIDRIDQTVLLKRRGLFLRQETLYAFDEIERFCLVEEKDDEGASIWSLGMKLIDADTIVISSQQSHDERFISNFVFQTNEFMHKQMPAAEMVLELEDEDEQ